MKTLNLTIALLTLLMSLSANAQGFDIDVRLDQPQIEGESAETLMQILILAGGEEIFIPELPSSPSVKYTQVKGVHFKNMTCFYYVLNPNYNGIDFGDLSKQVTACSKMSSESN